MDRSPRSASVRPALIVGHGPSLITTYNEVANFHAWVIRIVCVCRSSSHWMSVQFAAYQASATGNAPRLDDRGYNISTKVPKVIFSYALCGTMTSALVRGCTCRRHETVPTFRLEQRSKPSYICFGYGVRWLRAML